MADQLQTTWFPELDIPTVLRPVMSVVSDARYLVVSMIDSTPGVSSLPSLVPILESLAVAYEAVGGDVVVDSSVLVDLAEDCGLLTGFDEIWLCREIPSSPKPASVKITSDCPLIGEPPAGLAAWMAAATCRVGLGDGDGLNLATVDSEVATAVVNINKALS